MAYSKVMHKTFGEPAIHELQAAAACTPGQLLELTSATKVQPHSTAGGRTAKMFAIENPLAAGGTIATASGASDFVPFVVARPGDIVIARLYTSENVAVGDYLESHGDGTLRKVVADTSAGTIALNSLVGQAMEASNVASVALIKVMVL